MSRERIVSVRLDEAMYDQLKRRAGLGRRSVSALIRREIESLQQDGNCSECGTRRMVFDPPLEFDLTKACGVVKPGTYAANSLVPICDMPADHEGNHVHLVERTGVHS